MAMNSRRRKNNLWQGTSNQQQAASEEKLLKNSSPDDGSVCPHTYRIRNEHTNARHSRWKVFCFSRANTHTEREFEPNREHRPRRANFLWRTDLFPNGTQTFLLPPSGWMSCGRERKREKEKNEKYNLINLLTKSCKEIHSYQHKLHVSESACTSVLNAANCLLLGVCCYTKNNAAYF